MTKAPVSAELLEQQVQAGRLWLIIGGQVYDATAWSAVHPGGMLLLQHSAGLDVSAAFAAYHPPAVGARLPAFWVGPMHPDVAASPAGVSRTAKLAAVHQQLEQAGLFQTSPWAYWGVAARCCCLLAAAVLCLIQQWPVPAAVLLGLFWQQVAFVGHDAGHNAVTHDRFKDGLIGLLVNACIGIGPSWWKATHNVHHTVVNSVDCDPDIQFMPLLAVSDAYFKSVFSRYHLNTLVFDKAAAKLISVQHLTFLPLLMVAKFGLYLQSVKQLASGMCYIWRPAECCSQALFFAGTALLVSLLNGWGSRLAFILLSHATFGILHLQICLSHFAKDTYEGLPPVENDWLTTQLNGTMNWSCPPALDWFHGGLQFQIEHHIFPRLPRHNLRAASRLVQPLCKQHGLPYISPGFIEATFMTLQTLRSTALKAKRHELLTI
eukprot:jgi/Astpho2/5478/e_gw1.00078.22.1_t